MNSRNPKLSTAILVLYLALVAQNSSAQSTNDSLTPPSSSVESPWRFSVGAGLTVLPAYPGSKESKALGLPVLNISYGNFFFGGDPSAGVPAGLGWNLYRDSQWRVGVSLSQDLRRRRIEADYARLQGLGDIDRTTRAGLFASYQHGWMIVRTSLNTDVGGKGQGTQWGVDLLGRIRAAEGLMFSAGPGFTWADRKHSQAYYGVDADQSARSGLPEHSGEAGLQSYRISMGMNYQLSRQWGVGANFAWSRLRGAAAGSPITETANQSVFGLFTMYRF